MKNHLTSLFLLIILGGFSSIQAQSDFQYLYQSEASIESFVAPASNGDILMAVDSYNDTAAFFHRLIVQRLDIQGNVLQTAGLFRPPSFRMGSIKATSDNGLLVMGTVNIPLTDVDTVFVIKLDAMGQKTWSKGFQVEANIHVARGAIETSDGSYLVYGTYEHINFAEGIFLMKIDPSGTLIWSRTINSQLAGAFMKVGGVVETANGDFWLSGSTRFNSEGSWLAKLNSTGETQSVIFYNTHDLTQSQPEPFAIFGRSNGELDIFYNSTAFQSGSILLAVHADANGAPLQTTRFYHGNNFGEITDIQPTADGGYVACGYRFPGTSNRSDGLAMKIASNYNVAWAKTYGTDYIEITNSIFQGSDGGIVMGGFADFDSVIISPSENGLFPWLLKTNDVGNATCYSQNATVTRIDTTTTTMAYQLDNVAGVALGDVVFNNISVEAKGDTVSCLPTSLSVLEPSAFSMYPNPTQGNLTVALETPLPGAQLTVFDPMGKIIHTQKLDRQTDISLQFNAPAGLYFLALQTVDGKRTVQKIIKK